MVFSFHSVEEKGLSGVLTGWSKRKEKKPKNTLEEEKWAGFGVIPCSGHINISVRLKL